MHISRLAFLTLCAALCLSAAAQAQGNPSQQDTERYRGKPCRDPWINLAFRDSGGAQPVGAGDLGECSPALYNGGSWSSYAELLGAVRGARSAVAGQGLAWKFVQNADNKSDVRVGLISGGNVIAVGGGNVIAVGGGNVVAPGGANVIAVGGGNLNSLPKIEVSRGGYSVMSGAKKVVKLGNNSTLVIR